ncbi:DUF1707 domain-containing protein [Nocardia sp. 2]|uniref:DUF1707 domain-containing protein n=1 Tax=Nocardia acididurans TaxID=2802282 RepID=A0ABS1MHP4_9NOCA|nr:DUF1707 domain-containing protein [Nocardia acididurans]MBL1079791.1 DUF1707 domain-containing protein [Nocardia acididurans]
MVSPFESRLSAMERERALQELSAHLVEGRLDAGEFDERCMRVGAARTRGQLADIFLDLPGYGGDVPNLTRSSAQLVVAAGMAVVALGLLLLTGSWWWLSIPLCAFVVLAVRRRG